PAGVQSYRGLGAIDIRVETRVLGNQVTGTNYVAGSAGNEILLAGTPIIKAFANPQYNYNTNVLDFTVWLESNGQVVTTPTSCIVVLTETNGGAIVANQTSA